ncbi:MAG: universal stress protein [Bradyrhizobium sp.]|jgi:nucleotide-binding universal stress UspA family protein
MPFKSIAVFVDATPGGEARTAYAAGMASRHGAHLIGIFAVPSSCDGSPAESFVQGRQAVRQVIANHRSREAAAIDAAKRSFSAICARNDVSFEFRFLHEDDFNDGTALNSLHADLVIVGGPRPGGLPRDWSAEALLLATGVPFLLLPEPWKGTAAEHVVVAWNASREARRAIADALPFLVGAQSVTVLVVDPEKNPRHGEEPGADIAQYLIRHGARVVVEQVQSKGEPIAKTIMAHAERHHSDLIVVGAYSHARTTEMIFGGVTRSLLRDASVPLLIAH